MKKIYEDIKNSFESKTTLRILFGIGIVIIALLIFSLGVNVGFRRASYGLAWEENYEHNFGMKPNRPVFESFPNASGAIGKIIKVQLPTLIVEDKDNTEKIVLLNDDTKIQDRREEVTANDLKIDDYIVVIGSPNAQGQIEAKFIRVMPLGIPAPLSPETPPVPIN